MFVFALDVECDPPEHARQADRGSPELQTIDGVIEWLGGNSNGLSEVYWSPGKGDPDGASTTLTVGNNTVSLEIGLIFRNGRYTDYGIGPEHNEVAGYLVDLVATLDDHPARTPEQMRPVFESMERIDPSANPRLCEPSRTPKSK